jgi:hypothetical protein
VWSTVWRFVRYSCKGLINGRLAATGSFVATEKIINVFFKCIFIIFVWKSKCAFVYECHAFVVGFENKKMERKKYRGCYLLFEADQKNAFLCNFLVMHFGTLTCRTRFDDHIKNCISSNKLWVPNPKGKHFCFNFFFLVLHENNIKVKGQEKVENETFCFYNILSN